jgi:hypothetical protein
MTSIKLIPFCADATQKGVLSEQTLGYRGRTARI